jgi:transposase InsO family protein
LFLLKELPDAYSERQRPFFRLYYGPEFIARMFRPWYERLVVAPLFIGPGSSWENGYVEFFNRKLRDELPNGKLFYTLHEVRVIVKGWR